MNHCEILEPNRKNDVEPDVAKTLKKTDRCYCPVNETTLRLYFKVDLNNSTLPNDDETFNIEITCHWS